MCSSSSCPVIACFKIRGRSLNHLLVCHPDIFHCPWGCCSIFYWYNVWIHRGASCCSFLSESSILAPWEGQMVTGTLFAESLAFLSLFLPSWWGSSERLRPWDKRQCRPVLRVLIVVGEPCSGLGSWEEFAVERGSVCFQTAAGWLSFLVFLHPS